MKTSINAFQSIAKNDTLKTAHPDDQQDAPDTNTDGPSWDQYYGRRYS